MSLIQSKRQKLYQLNTVRQTKNFDPVMQFERQWLRSTKCSSKNKTFDVLNAVRKIKTCYLQLSLKFTRKRWLIFKFYRIEGVVTSERFRASTRPLPIKKMCVVDRAKGQYNFGKNPYYNQNNFHDHWIFQNSRFLFQEKWINSFFLFLTKFNDWKILWLTSRFSYLSQD